MGGVVISSLPTGSFSPVVVLSSFTATSRHFATRQSPALCLFLGALFPPATSMTFEVLKTCLAKTCCFFFFFLLSSQLDQGISSLLSPLRQEICLAVVPPGLSSQQPPHSEEQRNSLFSPVAVCANPANILNQVLSGSSK